MEGKGQELFERATKYYEKNIKELIEIWGGRFVMIYGPLEDKTHEMLVVDSDLDDFELAKRHELRMRGDSDHIGAIHGVPKTYEEYLEFQKLPKGGRFDGFEFGVAKIT